MKITGYMQMIYETLHTAVYKSTLLKAVEINQRNFYSAFRYKCNATSKISIYKHTRDTQALMLINGSVCFLRKNKKPRDFLSIPL